MPKDLKDFPRPPSDNGRGLHGSASAGWSGGKEGYAYWISELVAMGIKWFKVLDDGGDSLTLCEKLLAAGIFPIVRIIRRDPPPNDTPEPNPGHVGPAEEQTIQRLIAAGVRYFETNNEPNLGTEWKHTAMPGDPLETARLVALNWLFDARFILDAGGLPGLPAISVGGSMDLMGALVSLGRQDLLLEGCWIALHNYSLNRPLGYPDDPVNRTGQPLPQMYFNQGAFTQWFWWNSAPGRADTLDEINAARASGRNPTETIVQDHACFREFEYYNHLAMKYLGRSLPSISTAGGPRVGRREDPRYPRLTPQAHRDQIAVMFNFMQRQAPDYYFAATPWLWLESPGWEADAWNSSFWHHALKNGSDGHNGIPTFPVEGAAFGDHLPVMDAVKAMPTLARRLPGAQPAPPVQPPITVSPAKPTPTSGALPPPPETMGPSLNWPAAFPGVPPPPAATPPPAAPTPQPPPLPPSEPTLELDWDPRLDALNVSLEPAKVAPGQAYWKLTHAEYQGPDEAGGKHHVYYTVLDEHGQPQADQKVWQGWLEDKTDAVTNEQGKANIPLWASFAPGRGESGPYFAWIDGLPSERVHGMGLPFKRHVSFFLTWQRTIA